MCFCFIRILNTCAFVFFHPCTRLQFVFVFLLLLFVFIFVFAFARVPCFSCSFIFIRILVLLFFFFFFHACTPLQFVFTFAFVFGFCFLFLLVLLFFFIRTLTCKPQHVLHVDSQDIVCCENAIRGIHSRSRLAGSQHQHYERRSRLQSRF